MARREADTGCGEQIDKRIWEGGRLMYRIQNLFILLRASDCENTGMRAGDKLRLCAEATGDDDATVFA